LRESLSVSPEPEALSPALSAISLRTHACTGVRVDVYLCVYV
jgi:hypothetical protein